MEEWIEYLGDVIPQKMYEIDLYYNEASDLITRLHGYTANDLFLNFGTVNCFRAVEEGVDLHRQMVAQKPLDDNGKYKPTVLSEVRNSELLNLIEKNTKQKHRHFVMILSNYYLEIVSLEYPYVVETM